MNKEVLNSLLAMAGDIQPAIERLGKDGKRVEAFFLDWKDALQKAKNLSELGALADVAFSLVVLFTSKVTLVRWYNPFSWGSDPLKDFRKKADEYAKLLDFKRYKILAKL